VGGAEGEELGDVEEEFGGVREEVEGGGCEEGVVDEVLGDGVEGVRGVCVGGGLRCGECELRLRSLKDGVGLVCIPSSAYSMRPRVLALDMSCLTTRVVSHDLSRFLTASGKSFPAMTRQPVVFDCAPGLKRRTPSVAVISVSYSNLRQVCRRTESA
jgi:hypothetical protein